MDANFCIRFHPTAQVRTVKKNNPNVADSDITIPTEVNDIDGLYKEAVSLDYKIIYPITNEPLGVMEVAAQIFIPLNLEAPRKHQEGVIE